MLIEVQHFQQLERSLGHQVALRLAQTSQNFWGFTHIELDEDGIGLGRLRLKNARGVFPDGTPFAMPQHDPLPAALDTEGGQAGDLVCLAVLGAREGGAEMAFGDVPVSARYRAVETEVQDASAGLDAPGTPRRLSMQTGQLLTRLCWKSQLRADEVWLPVARVEGRRSLHAISLDHRFIPTLLNARAHEALRSLCDELQSVLRVRLAGSAGLRHLSAGGGLADLIELMLRQTLCEYRMRLAHLDALNPLPPAFLHLELIGLLGRLSVLPGMDDALTDSHFPYLHDDLQASFEPLSVAVRHALARVIETPLVPLRFQDRGDQVHLCMVDRQWRLEKLVFAFQAAMPAEQLRSLLPQQIKLGPVEQIQRLVDLQLPGARLIAQAHPPRLVPYYAQSVYFEVESADPYWSQIWAGSAMALRIVGDFPELRFEAWGLRQGKVS